MNPNTEVVSTPAQNAKNETFVAPRTDILADQDGYIIEAELPGVTRDRLTVSVENQKLTIIGRRAEEAQPGQPIYRESARRSFRRTFELDPSIDVTRINAHLEQGLLRLTLPKSEAVKPRKIEVASA